MSSSAVGDDGILKETPSTLWIEASRCLGGGIQMVSGINPSCFDENIIFLAPLSKQVCICVC